MHPKRNLIFKLKSELEREEIPEESSRNPEIKLINVSGIVGNKRRISSLSIPEAIKKNITKKAIPQKDAPPRCMLLQISTKAGASSCLFFLCDIRGLIVTPLLSASNLPKAKQRTHCTKKQTSPAFISPIIFFPKKDIINGGPQKEQKAAILESSSSSIIPSS